MGKNVFLVFMLCGLLLPTIAFAYDEEASGDGLVGSIFPTDDEDDYDENFSGSGDGIIIEVDKTETIDVIPEEITEEPEINEHFKPKKTRKLGRNKMVTKNPVKEEKNVEVENIEEDVVIKEDIEIEVEEKPAAPEETDDDEEEEPVVVQRSSLLDSKNFLIAVIIGGCIGVLFTICVIMLLVYRMRKKDEGSYALDDKNTNFEYTKGISKEYHV